MALYEIDFVAQVFKGLQDISEKIFMKSFVKEL